MSQVGWVCARCRQVIPVEQPVEKVTLEPHKIEFYLHPSEPCRA